MRIRRTRGTRAKVLDEKPNRRHAWAMTGNQKNTSPPPGWRFPVGVAVFLLGFFSPALIPFVTGSDLSIEWKTAITGALAVGVPEVMAILAAAVMGKEGFQYLKGRIFAFFKKHAPPDEVGPVRYRIGLAIFILPLLFGWLAPYAPHVKSELALQTVPLNLVGDAMFITSFFVLGGDFWDKVRALFIHGAKAKLPPATHKN